MRCGECPLASPRAFVLEVDPRAPVQLYLGTAEAEIARYVRRLATRGPSQLRCRQPQRVLRPGARPADEGTRRRVRVRPRRRRAYAAQPGLNPSLARLVQTCQAYVSYETNPAAGAVTLDALVERAGAPGARAHQDRCRGRRGGRVDRRRPDAGAATAPHHRDARIGRGAHVRRHPPVIRVPAEGGDPTTLVSRASRPLQSVARGRGRGSAREDVVGTPAAAAPAH